MYENAENVNLKLWLTNAMPWVPREIVNHINLSIISTTDRLGPWALVKIASIWQNHNRDGVRDRKGQVTVVYSLYRMCVLITVHGQNPSPGVVIMILCFVHIKRPACVLYICVNVLQACTYTLRSNYITKTEGRWVDSLCHAKAVQQLKLCQDRRAVCS